MIEASLLSSSSCLLASAGERFVYESGTGELSLAFHDDIY